MDSIDVGLKKSGIARLKPGDAFIPTRALSRPSRPNGSGQARVPDWSRRLGSSPWAPSPPRGLPLLLPRTGETVAAGAVHRLARPHAQQARPRRPSVPDRRPANAQMPGQAGQKGEAVKRLCQLPPEASTVTDSCRFNPSQPPKGGAINARALSSLRITVGAKNPRHNITQHCITPRGSGGSQNRPWKGAWSSPPNQLCACCGLYNVMLC